MTLPFKAVAVDMDGTFLDDRKQFNHKEFDQILTEFEQRGVHFIVASGRPYVRLKQDFGKFASRMDFVTLNGSRLIIKGQEAGSYLLNRDDVLKLIHDVHVKYGEMATMVFGRDIAYLQRRLNVILILNIITRSLLLLPQLLPLMLTHKALIRVPD